MNTYIKFAPNIFLAKCTEPHEKGEIINVTTKYGKENESEVYNLIASKDGFYFYSIIRADGFNFQERARRKAERFSNWSAIAEKKSNEYFERSNKDKDFLSLGEPIKVGHHSEKRHRKIIDQSWNNMGKSVELSRKSSMHESKSEYWKGKESEMNLSMPECLEYYEFKLEAARERHSGLKDGTIKRDHDYSLTYAKNAVNEAKKNLEIALKLWA